MTEKKKAQPQPPTGLGSDLSGVITPLESDRHGKKYVSVDLMPETRGRTMAAIKMSAAVGEITLYWRFVLGAPVRQVTRYLDHDGNECWKPVEPYDSTRLVEYLRIDPDVAGIKPWLVEGVNLWEIDTRKHAPGFNVITGECTWDSPVFRDADNPEIYWQLHHGNHAENDWVLPRDEELVMLAEGGHESEGKKRESLITKNTRLLREYLTSKGYNPDALPIHRSKSGKACPIKQGAKKHFEECMGTNQFKKAWELGVTRLPHPTSLPPPLPLILGRG